MEPHENAIVAALWLDGGSDREKLSLAELYSLAATAGVEVLAEFTQNRSQVDNRYYIGPGKAKEIGDYIEQYQVSTVIFDKELSPSQVKNLEKIIPAKIIDRSELIMDIFAQRANSKEGQLQVELAQLRYQLPKLMGKGRDLSRLAGGIGTKEPNKSKLETDRRRLRERVHKLEQQLKKVESHRALLQKHRQRQEVFHIALVGYTNSGKSTLLNQMTKANAYTDHILFATLDPLSRRLETGNGPVILTDTVGFIGGLPHHLIAAFKSTLEVVVNADLLIHVVDISHPDLEMQIREVNKVLGELGCQDKEQLIAINKIDATPAHTPEELASFFRDIPHVRISALKGTNITELLAAIRSYMEPLIEIHLNLPVQVYENLNSKTKSALSPLEFSETAVSVKGRLPAKQAASLKKQQLK